MGNLKDKTVNGVLWSAVERFGVRGVQFLLGIVMARLLTPSDYGLIAIVSVFMSISYVFIDSGFATALIQCKDRTEEDFSTVFHINLCLSVLFYIGLFFAAPYIAIFYNQPELTLVARVYMLNLIINSFVSINRVKIAIDLNFKQLTRVTVLAALLSGLLGVVSAFYGMGVWALVVQMVSNAVFNWIFFALVVKWWPQWQFSKASFKKLFKFGSKMFVAQLIDKLYNNLNTLVIGKFYSSSELGVFNRGHRFADFAGSNAASVMNRVAFPAFSKIQDDDKKLLDAYGKYIRLATFLIFPLMMCLCGMSKPFILFLLTSKWEDAIIIMQILCPAYLFTCVTSINLNLLYVKGRSDLVLRLEIIKKIIALSLLLFTLQYGLVAICIGRLCYSFIALYLNTLYTKKILNYGLYEQIKDFFPSLIMSIIIAAIGIIISYFISLSWLALFLCMVFCPTTYYCMAKATNNVNLAELNVIFNQRKPFSHKRH